MEDQIAYGIGIIISGLIPIIVIGIGDILTTVSNHHPEIDSEDVQWITDYEEALKTL